MGVRLATPRDAGELKRLNDLFNGEGCNDEPGIARSLNDNDVEIVCVYEADGMLVGFCCGQIFQTFCYTRCYCEITELFVHERYRDQGIGARLAEFIEDRFILMGAEDCQLHTGRENPGAQRFYRAHGYAESADVMFRKRLKGVSAHDN